MKSPYTYFGGKRKVAGIVWDAIGDVDRYIEPFAGSLAVLLDRPSHHKKKFEVVNDKNGFICNFWRALKAEPDAVAAYADSPKFENDLHARHAWLVAMKDDLVARLEGDPEYYDVKVAGWWVWGINNWFGGPWCRGDGAWRSVDGRLIKCSDGNGVSRQRIDLGRPFGIFRTSVSSIPDYLRELADRISKVTVCCGDWSCVVTRGACAHGRTVGVFLDPPYLGEIRQKGIYACDDHDISHSVREWALSNGDDPKYRIVLAGYEDEHAPHMPESWRTYKWSAGSSYGTTNSSKTVGGNRENRHKERLWFSPHCNLIELLSPCRER